MKLLETIRIKDGKVYNIEYHNRRVDRSRFELFGIDSKIDLRDYIAPPRDNGIFRCRVIYNRSDIVSVEYIPYKKREFKSFIIIDSNIEYKYKYSNRDKLNRLKEQYSKYSDIIIKKSGFLTDTSIANIAFFDGSSWVTPKNPLLRGTIRERLIEKNILIKKDIKSEDLKHFSYFALMNAMIGFQITKNITIHIDKKEKICL